MRHGGRTYHLAMAKAVADPAELRRFAQDLRKLNADLQAGLATVSVRLNGLSQTWRDQEQAKFVEEFEQTVKVLQRFIKASESHVPFLLRKADRIDEYLNQK
jgi:uncharacterized protein YukE